MHVRAAGKGSQRDYVVTSGGADATYSREATLVVQRKLAVGSREQLVPPRLLYGIIPDCLLEDYSFWQDIESGQGTARLRGYKTEAAQQRDSGKPLDVVAVSITYAAYSLASAGLAMRVVGCL